MATCPECLFLPQATTFDGTQWMYKDTAFKHVELQMGVESKEAGETFHTVNSQQTDGRWGQKLLVTPEPDSWVRAGPKKPHREWGVRDVQTPWPRDNRVGHLHQAPVARHDQLCDTG